MSAALLQCRAPEPTQPAKPTSPSTTTTRSTPPLPPPPTSTSPTATPATVHPVTAAELGATWRLGCPVGPELLRRVDLNYIGFDGQTHRGELIVHQDVAADVIAIFEQLHRLGYPIAKMQTVARYPGAEDELSMQDNNTSAFNCRLLPSGRAWALHAYGRAIDVNPLINPVHRQSRRHSAEDGRAIPRPQSHRPGNPARGRSCRTRLHRPRVALGRRLAQPEGLSAFRAPLNSHVSTAYRVVLAVMLKLKKLTPLLFAGAAAAAIAAAPAAIAGGPSGCYDPAGTGCAVAPGGAAGTVPGGPAGMAGPEGAAGAIPGGPGGMAGPRRRNRRDSRRPGRHSRTRRRVGLCAGRRLRQRSRALIQRRVPIWHDE